MALNLRILAILAVAACTEPLDLAEDEAAIIDGTPLAQGGAGFVLVEAPLGLCSGTALTNGWVVTAGHCFPDGDAGLTPATAIFMGDSIRGVDEIILDPLHDIALLKVPGALALGVPAATSGFDRGLWRGTDAALIGRVAQCVGHGFTDAQGGGGTLRAAALAIDRLDGGHLVVVRNARGQLLAPGDSGGGCLVHDSSGQQVLAGVTRAHDAAQGTAYLVPTSQLRSSVSESLMVRELRTGGDGCIGLGARTPGTPLAMPTLCRQFPSEQWRFVPAPGNTVLVKNVESQQCIDVGTGGLVTKQTCRVRANQTATQRFVVSFVPGGTRLRNAATGTCLRKTPAGGLVHGDCGTAFEAATTFDVISHPMLGHRTLTVTAGTACADVPWGQATPGLAINRHPCHDGAAQEWELRATSSSVFDGGRVTVRPRGNGALCLQDRGASVTQEVCTESAAQQWRLRALGNHEYRLYSGTDACLSSTTTSGLRTFPCDATLPTTQAWQLRWH